MQIKKFVVGQMSTNCYLIINKDHCSIIDPGDDGQAVIDYIQSNNLIPDIITCTHGHFDHLLSVLEIKTAYNIPFALSKDDNFLRKKANRSALHFLNIYSDPIPEIEIDLSKINEIRLADILFEVIKTPGHTPGSLCLYNKKENILFCGDLIFENGVMGRCAYKYSNKNNFFESVNFILNYPDNTKVYSGHGDPFYLKDFKSYFKQNN